MGRVFLFCWFCGLGLGLAGKAYSQSLTQSDSLRLSSLLQKADQFMISGDFIQAHSFADEAVAFARQKGLTFHHAAALLKKGEIFLEEDQLDQVETLAKEAHSLGQEMANAELMAKAELLHAQALMYGGQVKESLPVFEQAIEKYFKSHPSEEAALAYNDYGYALGLNGEPEKQINNLIISKEILEQVNPENFAELGVTLNNISIAYYSLRDMPKAIAYALQSIGYREKAGDKAKMALGYCNISQFYRGIDQGKVEEYLSLCAQLAEEAGDQDRMSQAYITSALLYSDQGDREKALEYEQKAMVILQKKGQDPAMISRRFLSMAMHAVALEKDSLTVMNYFNQSLAYNQRNLNKANFRDLYQQLAFYFRSQGRYRQAYDYINLHTLYRDSIIQENTLSNIAELEKKFETEKKDNEILRLLNQDQLKELEIEKQKALLSQNLLEVGRKEQAITLLTQNQELNQLRIQQQNEELLKQGLLATTKEQELALAAKESEIQERQLQESRLFRNLSFLAFGILVLIGYFLFNRYKLQRKLKEQEALLAIRGDIAKDLHDEIGSILTSIKILSEVSAKKMAGTQEPIRPYLHQITAQSVEAQQGMSDIVWAVNPENDKIGDLVVRMREYLVKTLEPKDIQIQLLVEEQVVQKKLTMNQRRDFLMMFKEVINNIAKHAEAKKVSIQLLAKGQDLLFSTKDDGIGFDLSASRSSSGLKNLYSRAKAMGGTCTISSVIGSGTEVQILLPPA
ncbi:tetratricopeptide repeat-containing sensor histidine kinase [Algoriphagus litoralis]|uniref:tetratricopeptide repeat-containing sensor histidine kinase n=1 Tax=Algoriphagus litoralis TaxID=2202829 RepID=UPI000DB960A7|nr:histidine kinase [Algoriphagus litoralis]